MTEWRENPLPPVADEDTVETEKRRARESIEMAATGAERTHRAVSFLSGLVTVARDLHETNDYRRRMLALMRGTNAA